MNRALALVAAVGVFGVTADAFSQSGAGFPEFPDRTLKLGRTVWLGTCRECHSNTLADAPQVKDRAQWAKRAAKGKPALYASALKGLTTANTEMPPRGGNAKLSDDEVKAAVEYMLAIAK
jgi:cytochrome c5